MFAFVCRQQIALTKRGLGTRRIKASQMLQSIVCAFRSIAVQLGISIENTAATMQPWRLGKHSKHMMFNCGTSSKQYTSQLACSGNACRSF